MNYSFKKLVRENTGRHMLDSGGETGRHWQRELNDTDLIIVEVDYENNKVDGTINTHLHLDDTLTIDEELTDEYRAWLEANDEPDTYESFHDWSKLNEVLDVDNTYNSENDLSQDFLFAVSAVSQGWHYDDEALIYISTHNGADIRGGYSSGVICTINSDRHLLNIRISWYCDESGNEYSTYELNKLIKEIIDFNKSTDELKVRLKNGSIETLTPWS